MKPYTFGSITLTIIWPCEKNAVQYDCDICFFFLIGMYVLVVRNGEHFHQGLCSVDSMQPVKLYLHAKAIIPNVFYSHKMFNVLIIPYFTLHARTILTYVMEVKDGLYSKLDFFSGEERIIR